MINFFESLLKKALGNTVEQEQSKLYNFKVLGWFSIWIDQYLSGLKSQNEQLRDSICNLITPIVIKINKNSLPFILSSVIHLLINEIVVGKPPDLAASCFDILDFRLTVDTS